MTVPFAGRLQLLGSGDLPPGPVALGIGGTHMFGLGLSTGLAGVLSLASMAGVALWRAVTWLDIGADGLLRARVNLGTPNGDVAPQALRVQPGGRLPAPPAVRLVEDTVLLALGPHWTGAAHGGDGLSACRGYRHLREEQVHRRVAVLKLLPDVRDHVRAAGRSGLPPRTLGVEGRLLALRPGGRLRQGAARPPARRFPAHRSLRWSRGRRGRP